MLESIFSLLSSPLLWISIVVLYTLKKGILIIPQNRGFVVYTLGRYSGTLGSGLHFIIPFIQTVAADVNLKEESLPINSQTAITKDNITLDIDGILFLKVTDAAAATNNITDYRRSIVQLAMTTMRNSIGSMELDECLQNRDTINGQILKAMTEATTPWGVQVTRYEIRDINPPASIINDMEKQMTAERDKRSSILTAEGIKISAIRKAEGEKESIVLAAQADKEEKVLLAQAEKEKLILEATGKAEAIRLVAEAEANALETIGKKATTEGGRSAVQFRLAEQTIAAHKAIADESTIVLTDGKSGNNVSDTVAQAIAVSSSLKLNDQS